MNCKTAPILSYNDIYTILYKRFNGEFSRLSDIPPPTELKDAKKAVARLGEAIKKHEKIALIGDYDVDGVSSTAIVSLFFKEIGYPLIVKIPNRFSDGYGVSTTVLNKIDADVVITVDNGISAFEAARVCKEREIDLIITDHHTPAETLPDAYAVVNPKRKDCKYPFKEICGAQVAWLIMALLKKELNLPIDMKQYLDIVSLAVIADVMPLISINRATVQAGLQQMMRSNRPSSTIIREFLNKSSITSEDIAFNIAPRINAAGRVDDASIALKFLTASTEAEAYESFEKLTELNSFRKEIEAEVVQEALSKINGDDDIIVAASEDWHEGVVGIVASRLVDKFKKPAIVLSINGERAKGSARSIADVNIFELISTQSSFLDKFGGHKMAAGLSLQVQEIDKFREAINIKAKEIPKEAFIVEADVLGELKSISNELLDILEQFEPFGEANPRPKFLMRNVEVKHVRHFGSDKAHTKLIIESIDKSQHELVIFKRVLDFKINTKITCHFTINKNEYNGRSSLQIMVVDIYEES